jgi:hypothetical protein
MQLSKVFDEYRPPMQLIQFGIPCVVYVPFGQLWHTTPFKTFPLSQYRQEVLPVANVVFKLGQFLHVNDPLTFVYFPTSQFKQSAKSVFPVVTLLYFPGLQYIQLFNEELPSYVENLDAGQFLQIATPTCF